MINSHHHEKIIRRNSNTKSRNLLLNYWLNTFMWKRKLDVMKVRMIPLKFIWWRKVLVPTSKIVSGISKDTLVLKKEKNMSLKFQITEIVTNLGTSREIVEF